MINVSWKSFAFAICNCKNNNTVITLCINTKRKDSERIIYEKETGRKRLKHIWRMWMQAVLKKHIPFKLFRRCKGRSLESVEIKMKRLALFHHASCACIKIVGKGISRITDSIRAKAHFRNDYRKPYMGLSSGNLIFKKEVRYVMQAIALQKLNFTFVNNGAATACSFQALR